MNATTGISLRNTADRYGLVARALHWAIGLLLLGQIVAGFCAFEFMAKSAERSALIGVHKALGVVLLILVLVRIGWRINDRPPALPAALPERERKLASGGHHLLYLLMLLMPVLGILIVAYAGGSTDVFGMFTVPAFVGKDEALHDFFEDAHVWGAYALAAIIAVHAGAALWHKLVRKDGIAERML